MKRNLLNIADEIVDARNYLLEVSASSEAVEDTLEPLDEELGAKLAAYGRRLEELSMVSRHQRAIEADAKRLAEQAEAGTGVMINNLKAYLRTIGEESVKVGRYLVDYKPNHKKRHVEIFVDAKDLPAEFQREIPACVEANKAAIKKALEAGGVVEGCRMSDPEWDATVRVAE